MHFLSKKFFLAAMVALLAPLAAFAGDYVVENQPQALEKAVSLDHVGVLKQKDNGYLYVDVTNDFIAAVLPLIECEGKIVPPRHYTSKKGIGAHISVMYENERIENEIWNIEEMGQSYGFAVKEIRTVKVSSRGKMKKLWLIALEAPALETLRNEYGLSNLLKGHDFHITVGYQLPVAQNAQADVEWFVTIGDDLDEEVFAEAA